MNNSDIHLTMRMAGGRDLSNYADKIDTRHVIERIEEIESEYAGPDGVADVLTWAADDRDERHVLQGLLSECERLAEYEGHPADGMFLTRESAMREAVQEYHADTMSRHFKEYDPRQFKDVEISWDDLMSRLPFSCIDWDHVAEAMESDCDRLEYDGVTYVIF